MCGVTEISIWNTNTYSRTSCTRRRKFGQNQIFWARQEIFGKNQIRAPAMNYLERIKLPNFKQSRTMSKYN